MSNLKSLLFLLIQCFYLIANAQNTAPMSISGQWNFSLDPKDIGEKEAWQNKNLQDKINLPGTTDEANYGEKTVGSDYGILTRAHKYLGAAWYQREITIPKAWDGKTVELYLDRVLWQSKVWIDGRFCDTQDGLGVPHIHRLGKLKEGKHKLTLRINNDMMYNIGDKGHAYSEYMQSIWNGAVGRIELRPLEKIHLSGLNIWPDAENRRMKLTFNIENEGKPAEVTQRFILTEISSGATILQTDRKIKTTSGSSSFAEDFTIEKAIKKWDEFTPELYRLTVETQHGKAKDIQVVDFGFREVTASKSKVLVNGQPVFLRGNLDCVHFPITGYPSCDPKEWERIFSIYKSYGLNHVRFHSWCPPEAAFVAADRLGIYIQAEILWIDWWMAASNPERPDMDTKGFPQGLGKNPSADAFVQAEMKRMIDAYGNHPSFMMFCIGNELGNSDFDIMKQWVAKIKETDKRRLYAVSTARKITDVDDYSATHNIPGVGNTYGVKGYTTDYDLEANYSKAKVPIIAHELGQYPVYPLWTEINKYTGVLKARNLEQCRQSAEKNHLLGMNREFHQASGALQDLLYKAHIENLLRTPSCAGFQMLSMADYQGQGEALVGWLDCFWDAKGNTTPESFRRYSNVVVPLARFKKFVWETNETFEARVQVSNFWAGDISGNVSWAFTSGDGKLIEQGKIPAVNIRRGELKDIGNVIFPLEKIKQAGKINFSITLDGTEYYNSWNLWVYPPVKPEAGDVLVASTFSEEVQQRLAAGGKVLLLAHQLGTAETARKIFFAPLFWSTVFFPGQANSTLGLYVNQSHPALNRFPTGTFSHYQWAAISNGNSFVMNAHPNLVPIAQPISDFHINDKLASLFECKVGQGKLMVCGYNLTDSLNPVARQMKYNLLAYMNQSNFNPNYEIQSSELKKMLFYVPPVVSQAPKGFEKALLYVKCGEKMMESGSKKWDAALDNILVKNDKCGYQLTCDDVWKGEKGTAWTGKEITLTINTPNGVIGDLYVRFTDPNRQRREGTVWFEGREMTIKQIDIDTGKWAKIFVMREDTNDGKIVLKTKATQGGNLVISEVALVVE
jgi:hypothetical protein